MHEPDVTRKYCALCVGVMLGDALVTVGLADSVLDGEAVMLALSVALSLAELEAVMLADSLALELAVSLTLSLALSLAVGDAVREAELDAVFEGVSVLEGDAPIVRLQMHARSTLH